MRLIYLVAIVFFVHVQCISQIPGLNVYSSGGGFYSNPNNQFSVTIGEAVTETAPGPAVTLTQGFQQSDLFRILSGKVTYDNTPKSPLSGIQVLLKQGSVISRQTVTDYGGNYLFSDLQNGGYLLSGSSSKPWGGGNSLDAMLVAKHYVGTNPLSGIRLKAADVNASGGVNSIDALQISRRFVGLISSFALGDWVFEEHEVIVNGFSNLQDNFKGLCSGDVNGSFIPGSLKTEPLLRLAETGLTEARPGEDIIVPVSVKEETRIGALSLVLNYPSDQVKIKSVNTLEGDHSLVYNAMADELRISLYTLNPIVLKAGENLLFITLNCTWDKPSSSSSLHFSLGNESEMNDDLGNVMEDKTLVIPALIAENESFILDQNQPNPVNDITTIQFTLPEEGRVLLQLNNLLGQEIKVLMHESYNAGTYSYTLDCNKIPSGTYMYTLHYTTIAKAFRATRRMVVVH